MMSEKSTGRFGILFEVGSRIWRPFSLGQILILGTGSHSVSASFLFDLEVLSFVVFFRLFYIPLEHPSQEMSHDSKAEEAA